MLAWYALCRVGHFCALRLSTHATFLLIAPVTSLVIAVLIRAIYRPTVGGLPSDFSAKAGTTTTMPVNRPARFKSKWWEPDPEPVSSSDCSKNWNRNPG